MDDDERFIRYALSLSWGGFGNVEPNPLVGAVIARDGEILSEGRHAKFGEAHAEIVALRQPRKPVRGATLYVTLEPCCHFGKTPPCVDAIVAAGIKRVVVAMVDPFPQVAGQGIAKLREAGIEVTVGVCEDEARKINRPYLTLIEKGRPYVHCKWAMTLDGKIATRTGESKWISNESSRKIVHDLRSRMDAIIVGAETVRSDDPLLTARPPGPRIATRIVISTQPDLPPGCQLLRSTADAPVIVVSPLAPGQGAGGQLPANVEQLTLPDALGRVSIPALLAELARRRMTHVLVEGGSEVFGSFLDAGLVDEVYVFIAPHLFGGRDAKTPIGGDGIDRISSALRITEWNVETIDGDFYLHGLVSESDPVP